MDHFEENAIVFIFEPHNHIYLHTHNENKHLHNFIENRVNIERTAIDRLHKLRVNL